MTEFTLSYSKDSNKNVQASCILINKQFQNKTHNLPNKWICESFQQYWLQTKLYQNNIIKYTFNICNLIHEALTKTPSNDLI